MSYTEIDETAAGLTLGTQSASKVGFYAATPASRPANTVVARTALQKLGLLASGGTDTTVYTGANNTLTGANTLANTTFSEASNITLGNTTGTKIGTATANKIGFWNATPVVQPVGANQAAVGAVTTIGDNTGTPAAGLSLLGNTTTDDQGPAIMNDLAALREDLAATITLVNQLRSDLVDVGIVKGAA